MRFREVVIPVGQGVGLAGDLLVPDDPQGVVIFAHGTGSSRLSPRNRYVAGELNQAGLATLLMDLLSPAEEGAERDSGQLRFDIDLLTARLLQAGRLVRHDPQTRTLPIGYFGASTGAAAALAAAAREPERVGAVVARGGRPELASRELADVRAPTLLIVGGEDVPVIDMNDTALRLLRCEKRLAIVPGASHLFEEPGAIERVAELAREWFVDYLGRLAPPSGPRPATARGGGPRP